MPANITVASAWAAAVTTPEEVALARATGLDALRASALPGDAADSDNDSAVLAVQALCWAKMMRDDPLRLLRALRFSATLGFRLHAAFWLAAPFALQRDAMDAKVSPTRRLRELQRVAHAGVPTLINFLGLLLQPSSPVVLGGDGINGPPMPPPSASASASASAPTSSSLPSSTPPSRDGARRAAPYPFCDAVLGSDTSNRSAADARALGPFEAEEVARVAALLTASASDDVRLGAVLAAALLSCASQDGRGWQERRGDRTAAAAAAVAAAAAEEEEEQVARVGSEAAASETTTVAEAEAMVMGAEEEAAAEAAALETAKAQAARRCAIDIVRLARRETLAACDGLRAPTALRQAALDPLAMVERLLGPLRLLGVHSLLAQAVLAAPVSAPGESAGAISLNGLVSDGQPPSSAQLAAGWGRERSPSATPQERAYTFALLVRLWEVLKLDPSLAQRRLEVSCRTRRTIF